MEESLPQNRLNRRKCPSFPTNNSVTIHLSSIKCILNCFEFKLNFLFIRFPIIYFSMNLPIGYGNCFCSQPSYRVDGKFLSVIATVGRSLDGGQSDTKTVCLYTAQVTSTGTLVEKFPCL